MFGSGREHARSTGLLYRSEGAYRIAMMLLEGSERAQRHRRISTAIAAGSTVVDLCCGDASLASALLARGCTYLGLDINPVFVRSGQRRGLDVRKWDARSMEIPAADIVCMLSSFYQFIPNERPLFERMLQRARRLVVVSEPIRNWATSGSRVLQRVALAVTRVDGRTFERRHDEVSLRALVGGLDPAAVEIEPLGRETLLLVRTERLRGALKLRR
ncbi:MAG TPA: class I SAM-dependent methyltransferase [Candidatus Binatia bacterium]|nr:class I SAM-dependent methyltransferase [Candidatus Binatia bacterium]